MHIYIRTGDNENTGIEFLNGKGWELTGYERKGFAYTPPAGDARRYVFKESWNGKILPFQGGEKALAALRVAETHQYYGRLQVVSDVLDVRFVDAVNDILQGRDYYELVGYLKRLFNVEEVRR